MTILGVLVLVVITYWVYRGINDVIEKSKNLDLDNRQNVIVKRVVLLAGLWGLAVATVIYSYM